MTIKIVSGLIALVLIFGFIGAAVYKLRDAALVVVALIGLTMVIVDLLQSLRSKDK
jgi:hypothetical protein